jgi:uncharacterized protein (DUF4415 family)
MWTKRELNQQHRRDRQSGVAEEFLYRPNLAVRVPKDQRHDEKPGETDLRNVKVGIHIKLAADLIEFFKARAVAPNAAPYQKFSFMLLCLNRFRRVLFLEARDMDEVVRLVSNHPGLQARRL